MDLLRKVVGWLRGRHRNQEHVVGVEALEPAVLQERQALFANRRREVEAALAQVGADLDCLTDEWAALRCCASAEQKEAMARRRHFLGSHQARLEKQLRRLQKRIYILDTASALVEDQHAFKSDQAEQSFWHAIHSVISTGLAEEKAEDYRLDETMDQIAHAERMVAGQRESWMDEAMDALDRSLNSRLQGQELARQVEVLRGEVNAREGGNAQSSYWQDADLEQAQ